MIENQDYRLLPAENSDYWNIRIISGPFLDTVYNYTTLKITDDGEHLAYSCNIIESPDTDLTTDDPLFRQVTGEILTAIMDAAIEEENKK
jgi:hypothetical protein